MLPEIEPGSEWTARKIAERWIEYIPELLPAGINNLVASDYRSEQYKIRRATNHVIDLIKNGHLKETTGEPVEMTQTYECLGYHPLYGEFPAHNDVTKTNIPKFVLGKDLWGYENAELKKRSDMKVSKLNLSGDPKAQKEWMLGYVEKHQIDIKEKLPDTVLGDFLEEAEKVGMTKNSFDSRRRELKIRGIDRSEIKKKA
jgi:hypothetical protein